MSLPSAAAPDGPSRTRTKARASTPTPQPSTSSTEPDQASRKAPFETATGTVMAPDLRAPLAPFPDQEEIIGALVEHAGGHASGLVVAPTGYGKSLLIGETIQRLAQRHHDSHPKRFGRIAPFRAAIAVPNLTLARQIVDMARAQMGKAPRVTICCGDDEVLASSEAADALPADTLVTLDRDVVAHRFRKAPTDGRVDIFVGTYQAGVQVLIDGQRMAERTTDRELPVHFVAVDEAHRTFGAEFGAIHRRGPGGLRAEYRALFSATPVGSDVSPLLKGQHEVRGGSVVPHTYNLHTVAPLVAERTLADAVAAGRIKEPVVMPVFIRASTLDALRADLPTNPSPFRGVPRETAAAAYALTKAAARHGLSHIMTFHPTVQASKQMAHVLAEVAATGVGPRFDAQNVDGGDVAGKRRKALERFAQPTGHGEIRVLSNPEVFKEGQNTPVIDAVLLADAENSVRSNVQAFGRALRRTGPHGATRGIALLPMIVDDRDPEAPRMEPASRRRYQHFLLSYAMADGRAAARVQPDFEDLWETEPEAGVIDPALPERVQAVLRENLVHEQQRRRSRLNQTLVVDLQAIGEQTRAITPRHYAGVRWDNQERTWRGWVVDTVPGQGTQMLLDRAFDYPEDAARAVDATYEEHGFSPTTHPRNYGRRRATTAPHGECPVSQYDKVTWDPHQQKWATGIRVWNASVPHTVRRYFDTEEEAARGRDALLVKYATTAPRNFPQDPPRIGLITIPMRTDRGRLPEGVEFDHATGHYWAYAQAPTDGASTVGANTVSLGFFGSVDGAAQAAGAVRQAFTRLPQPTRATYDQLQDTARRMLALSNITPVALAKRAAKAVEVAVGEVAGRDSAPPLPPAPGPVVWASHAARRVAEPTPARAVDAALLAEQQRILDEARRAHEATHRDATAGEATGGLSGTTPHDVAGVSPSSEDVVAVPAPMRPAPSRRRPLRY